MNDIWVAVIGFFGIVVPIVLTGITQKRVRRQHESAEQARLAMEKESQKHTELRDIIDELREQVRDSNDRAARAQRTADEATTRADQAREAERDCAKRLHRAEEELGQMREENRFLAERVARLEGNTRPAPGEAP